MNSVKSRNIHVLFSKYINCIFDKTKNNTTIRQLNCKNCLDFKDGYTQNFASLLSIIETRHLIKFCSANVHFSTKSVNSKPLNLDSSVHYENVAEETLQSLYDRFEEILQDSSFEDWDVNYSNGVLTVTLEKSCVYVINKQTPNRQIWLSSPVSGPKRYDYVNGTWIYKHDGLSLHHLLTNELTKMLCKNVDFSDCNFGS